MGVYLVIGMVTPTLHTTAQANAYIDGNALYQVCTNPAEHKACLLYIAGVSDVNDRMQTPGVGSCLPATAALVQLRAVVLKHLEDWPEHRHHSAETLVIVALHQAFPCPAEK